MQNWLSANEWIFGLMGGMLLFFLGNAAKGYWDKQRGQDDDIRSLGVKLDEVNLNLSEIKYTLRERPDVQTVERIVDDKIKNHHNECRPSSLIAASDARG